MTYMTDDKWEEVYRKGVDAESRLRAQIEARMDADEANGIQYREQDYVGLFTLLSQVVDKREKASRALAAPIPFLCTGEMA